MTWAVDAEASPPIQRDDPLEERLVARCGWRAGASSLFDLGGRLDWRTMWFPVLPFALVAAVRSASRLVRPVVRRPAPAIPPFRTVTMTPASLRPRPRWYR